jgi:hypothetical protein
MINMGIKINKKIAIVLLMVCLFCLINYNIFANEPSTTSHPDYIFIKEGSLYKIYKTNAVNIKLVGISYIEPPSDLPNFLTYVEQVEKDYSAFLSSNPSGENVQERYEQYVKTQQERFNNVLSSEETEEKEPSEEEKKPTESLSPPQKPIKDLIFDEIKNDDRFEEIIGPNGEPNGFFHKDSGFEVERGPFGITIFKKENGDFLRDKDGNKIEIGKETDGIGGKRSVKEGLDKDDEKLVNELLDLGVKTKEDAEKILKEKGLEFEATTKWKQDYTKSMINKFKGRLSSALGSHFDNWLGKYTYGIPAAICGDSLYADTTDSQQKAGGFINTQALNPEKQTQFKSEMERKILEEMKTIVITGEKSELSPTLYRYAISLKLIGDSSETWKIYLYNSCTKDNSLEDAVNSDGEKGWYQQGALSKGAYVETVFAGGMGHNMIFDCELGKCRFNQACIEFNIQKNEENEKVPKYDFDTPGVTKTFDSKDKKIYCATLANGDGFITQGKTGSTEC